MIRFERAYKDYFEFSSKEDVDYLTMCAWAAKYDIDCVVLFYPDGFYYEIDYNDGRISGDACEIILEAIELATEAVFELVEFYLADSDIFDELSSLRDYQISVDSPGDKEKVFSVLIENAKKTWEEMMLQPFDSELFREKFLDSCMYVATAINLSERTADQEDRGEKGDDPVL